MATIRKRGNRYHVQIRRRGQSITRIFDRLATAKSWIPKIERDIERQLYVDTSGTERTTVGELLQRYQKQISPSHKGQQVEAYRLGTLKKHLGSGCFSLFGPFSLSSSPNMRVLPICWCNIRVNGIIRVSSITEILRPQAYFLDSFPINCGLFEKFELASPENS